MSFGPSTNDVRTEELLILRTKRLCEMWTMEGPKYPRFCGRPLCTAPFRQLPQEEEGRGRKRASIHPIFQAGDVPPPAGRLTCGASGFGALSLSLPYHRGREEATTGATAMSETHAPSGTLRLSHNRCDRRTVGRTARSPFFTLPSFPLYAAFGSHAFQSLRGREGRGGCHRWG